VQLADFVDLATRVGPILVFLIAITVVAELADGIGLFAIIARWAAVLGRGSVLGLWLLVVLVATVATAVLSLDTTAVLLTPVVLVLARRLGLGQELFAFTAVWLANTASLVLPVSNLTNLLAYARLRPAGVVAFTPLMWAPALAVWVVTVVLLGVVFRRRLCGRYEVPKPFAVEDRGLLLVAGVVCAGLGPAFVLGVDVTVAAVVGALVLVLACLLRRPRLVGWRLLPWPLVLGVSVLFVLVEIAHAYGLTALVTELVGQGDSWTDLLRLAGISAVAANLLNNLPAYLAVEPSALDSSLRLAALLVGVNAGALITPWASLATLLWAGRCRAAGLQVSWLRFAGLGAVLVPLCLLAGTGALALSR
jgi:arsenical pump membrane protein